MRRYTIMILALLFILLPGCSSTKDSKAIKLSGSLEGESVRVSSQLGGRIIEASRLEGETVKAGEMLYRIDDSILRLQREQAENQVKALEVQLKLAEDRGNDDQTKIAKYNLEGMRKSLAIIDENLKKSTVSSPAAGVISNLNNKAGELVQPGMQLALITDLTKIHLNIYIPERYLSKVKEGDNIEVRIPSVNGKVLKGRIARIDSKGQFTPKNTETVDDKSNVVYLTRIELDGDKDIRPGMTGEVELHE